MGSLGHETDDETGLIYMRARYYDPLTGRFASEDPKGDGVNWFEYAGDNPVTNVDETGRAASPAWKSAGYALLIGLVLGFTMSLGEWLTSGELNTFSPVWSPIGLFAASAIAYLGEEAGVGALSSIINDTDELKTALTVTGVVGGSLGAIGGIAELILGIHAGQIEFANFECDYDMQNA